MGKIADICSEMWAERALQRGEYKNNWLVSIRDHGNSFFDESNYAIRGIFSIQFARKIYDLFLNGVRINKK